MVELAVARKVMPGMIVAEVALWPLSRSHRLKHPGKHTKDNQTTPRGKEINAVSWIRASRALNTGLAP